jgi:thiopeptide-type bacteriocin biosynthesis protein
VERYGGEEGMRLAERVFHLDSLACLDLMEAEREGLCGRSRREVSLVLTERTLDLMGFDAGARLRFYRHGYQWALDKGTWTAEDLPVLDEKYAALRPGLASLFSEAGTERPDALWGGEAPARIAERFVADLRPVVEALLAAHAAGRIRQDIVDLAWAFTHMQCNRLGIGPVAEAILRYFMHRFAVEEAAAGA